MMIKVMLVEDHTMVRLGIALLLKSIPGIRIVGECDNGRTAVQEAVRLNPDVILMDLSMQEGMTGFTAIEEAKKALPNVRIVILTMYDGEGFVKQAASMGVEGYILKNGNSDDLQNAIFHAYQGNVYYRTSIDLEKIQRSLRANKGEPENHLTPREQEIVRLTALGLGNREMAEQLYISIKTVENHKTNIMAKLEISSRKELIAYAIKNRYLQLT
ncbi:response regulator transcription factor [Cohnella lubricantis]